MDFRLSRWRWASFIRLDTVDLISHTLEAPPDQNAPLTQEIGLFNARQHALKRRMKIFRRFPNREDKTDVRAGTWRLLQAELKASAG